MSKTYQHLFFDLDHTLWDFDKNSNETILELFAERGLERHTGISAAEFLQTYRSINEELWQHYRAGGISKEKLRIERFLRAFSRYGFSDRSVIEAFERDYLYFAPRKTALLEGALEIVEYLTDKYKVHIITNGFLETQHLKLKLSGLAPHFDLVMTSDELRVNKPAAKIFIESLKRVGASRKNSLMIGDNLIADVQGARKVGIDQVFYNPHHQAHCEKITFEVHHLLDMKAFL